MNGMRHKVLDRKNGNADTIKMEFFATESNFGSGKKRLFFLQLNQPDFSNNYWVSHGVEVFINKATVDAELALTQSDASVVVKFLLLKKVIGKKLMQTPLKLKV